MCISIRFMWFSQSGIVHNKYLKKHWEFNQHKEFCTVHCSDNYIHSLIYAHIYDVYTSLDARRQQQLSSSFLCALFISAWVCHWTSSSLAASKSQWPPVYAYWSTRIIVFHLVMTSSSCWVWDLNWNPYSYPETLIPVEITYMSLCVAGPRY